MSETAQTPNSISCPLRTSLSRTTGAKRFASSSSSDANILSSSSAYELKLAAIIESSSSSPSSIWWSLILAEFTVKNGDFRPQTTRHGTAANPGYQSIQYQSFVRREEDTAAVRHSRCRARQSGLLLRTHVHATPRNLLCHHRQSVPRAITVLGNMCSRDCQPGPRRFYRCRLHGRLSGCVSLFRRNHDTSCVVSRASAFNAQNRPLRKALVREQNIRDRFEYGLCQWRSERNRAEFGSNQRRACCRGKKDQESRIMVYQVNVPLCIS